MGMSHIVPNPFHNPSFTDSPTFDTVIQQPITFLFPSQSFEEPQSVHEDEMYDGGFVGSFAEIQFSSEEKNISDHMLMSGKTFKILNMKLKSLLQLQADGGGKHSIYSLEVDVML